MVEWENYLYYGPELYRYKGILNVEGLDYQIIFKEFKWGTTFPRGRDWKIQNAAQHWSSWKKTFQKTNYATLLNVLKINNEKGRPSWATFFIPILFSSSSIVLIVLAPICLLFLVISRRTWHSFDRNHITWNVFVTLNQTRWPSPIVTGFTVTFAKPYAIANRNRHAKFWTRIARFGGWMSWRLSDTCRTELQLSPIVIGIRLVMYSQNPHKPSPIVVWTP